VAPSSKAIKIIPLEASFKCKFNENCYYIVCDFLISRFEHCNREANKVAHELARLARFYLTYEWFEEPFSEILHILLNDVTVISI
jgi:hypothetical protein